MLLGASQCVDCLAGYVNPSQTQTYLASEPNASFYNPEPGLAQYYGANASASLGVSVLCQPW